MIFLFKKWLILQLEKIWEVYLINKISNLIYYYLKKKKKKKNLKCKKKEFKILKLKKFF
jgi:hypothetical protein